MPEKCTATDWELALRGPEACPPGSKGGEGDAQGKFMGEPSDLVLEMFNNTTEQILVARTPFLATVSRGTIAPDGSVTFASPTCWPVLQPPGCGPVDTALQLRSRVTVDVVTRTIDGVRRSYLTTAPTCPSSGRWQTPTRFWWSDGGDDTVVTEQRCTVRKRASRR